MTQTSTRSGFTLIELMLSMAFIGILLIATVATIIQVTNQYSKGITYKLINQAGRDLGVAIKRDAANVSGVGTPLVQPGSNSGELGRLCLGSYTYVWSNPSKLRDHTATKYSDTSEEIVMARVADGGGSLCVAAAGNYSTDIDKSVATEMLPNDKGDYAIHEITLDRIPAGGAVAGESLYSISYTIGTNDQGSIASSLKCELPSQATNNYNFCAINRFELMVQAGY